MFTQSAWFVCLLAFGIGFASRQKVLLNAQEDAVASAGLNERVKQLSLKQSLETNTSKTKDKALDSVISSKGGHIPGYPECNWDCLRDRYPDLQRHFGNDHSRLHKWYHEHGRQERRNCKCGDPALLKAVNDRRARAGIANLGWNYIMQRIATKHAEDMEKNKCFKADHSGCNGQSQFDRFGAHGYNSGWFADVQAKGKSGTAVFSIWDRNAEDAATMLSPAYKKFGAWRKGDYWVLTFGS